MASAGGTAGAQQGGGLNLKAYAVELKHVSKTFGSNGRGQGQHRAVVDINMQIRQGEFFTLLGPSGCGKTTTLRLIAGFETPNEGEIYLGGRYANELPPYKRPVNTVFQNYALFPHLSVAQNVGFGLAVKRVAREEREKRVRAALELVKLGGMGERKSTQISGGQQQRVALARALINRPSVLLLDEPLGALDLKLREQMQHELKQLQQKVGITFIYVTHDQEEALTMSDRIAVMNGGQVQQIGKPEEIYDYPSNLFVAEFIGDTNFLRGKVVSVEEDHTLLKVGKDELKAARSPFEVRAGQRVNMVIRPEKMTLSYAGMNGRSGTALEGQVRETVFVGTDTRVRVRLNSGNDVSVLVRNLPEGVDYKKGEKVNVWYDPGDSRLLPG
jgi:spermidine/putrescine transport system ATP-binding protein